MIRTVLADTFTSILPRHLKVSITRSNILKYLSSCQENSCGSEILNVLYDQPVHWTEASAILDELIDEGLIVETNYPKKQTSEHIITISSTRYSLATKSNEEEVA